MPPQIALLLWICISVAMFAMLPALRAFLLTYLIGYLVLPVEVANEWNWQGSIVFTQSLRIDKLTACNIGAVLGTVLFASQRFSRFRLHWVDAAYGMVLVGLFLTSLVNGLGAKDGLSHGIEELRQLLPLLLLSRLYLSDVDALYEAMRAIIAAAFLYAFLSVAEWRFSPQAHRIAYGYFQHSFDQFARYGHFRPVGFLHHAIELAFFMGTSAAMAAWLWYKKLLRPLWGVIPAPLVFCTILVGLITTLTYSGYGAFLLAIAVLALAVMTRSRWVLLILPVGAVIWMAGRYSNTIDASMLLRTAGYFDTTRQESLEYRLTAERLHLDTASQSLLLGKGALNGIVRDADGNNVKAVDAWWLITLVFYGLVGICGWYAIWCGGLVETLRRWRKLTPDFRTLAALIAVLIGAEFIDFLFNSFPSPFLLMLDMGLVGALQAYRPAPAVSYLPVYDFIDPADIPEGAALP